MTEEIVAVPLLEPANGTPDVIDTEAAFVDALKMLARGSGPLQLMLKELQDLDIAPAHI